MSMNKIIFVSFYSQDTIYEEKINKYLLPSLLTFRLPYWIKPIKNLGTWAQNTCQKPAVILEALNTFPQDIVWVDADAEILQCPIKLYEIPELYDIGVHYLSWEEHYGRKSDKGKFELVDGTIYIRNNKKMKEFIKEWKQNSTDKNINHQKILAQMLKKREDIKVFDFGREYCYIVSTPQGNPPAISLNKPVILHYQASRKARRKLK